MKACLRFVKVRLKVRIWGAEQLRHQMRMAEVADQLKEGLNFGRLLLFLAKVRMEPLVLSVKADEVNALHSDLLRGLINLSQSLKNLSKYLAISYDGVIPDDA